MSKEPKEVKKEELPETNPSANGRQSEQPSEGAMVTSDSLNGAGVDVDPTRSKEEEEAARNGEGGGVGHSTPGLSTNNDQDVVGGDSVGAKSKAKNGKKSKELTPEEQEAENKRREAAIEDAKNNPKLNEPSDVY